MALPKIQPYPLPTQAELPTARGAWQPHPERVALLVHDMQRYFLAAFTPEAAPLAPAVANIARLLTHCRARGIPVFYTAQRGNQDRRDRGLQADLWGPGMSATEAHETIIEAVAPVEGDHVLVKHRYSAFQRSNLETLMRARGRDQLLVTGVYAHIGCTATVAEGFQRDIESFIAADAVADFSRADHDLALHWIARTCGVPMTTGQLLEALA
ncbi:isochorismatase family protein [Stenotrophomonas rhizophila]|uniref:isochorismatase family protein n=1 Tax=Stenotrophomonas rhizophila TaxID=216778 RepID=UPI001E42FAE4|nr:isochorismatase family protein [Stenotrophomonas rhizophila]MCC7633949.1 isochorismatase family protein [Stenotrophomonas rhizophila]MCC7663283.1 isochorismatase family protein [Stenotrophomonas rhizophila]